MSRKIELFSAGCTLCSEAEALVRRLACPACEVEVLDMKDPVVAERAKALGVVRLPAVAVDGRLVECCQSGGIREDALRAAGVGQG